MKKLEISQMENVQGGKSCFSDKVGSTNGIILLAFSSFFGPEAYVVALGGIALTCA